MSAANLSTSNSLSMPSPFKKSTLKEEFGGQILATKGDGTCGPRAAIQAMIVMAKAAQIQGDLDYMKFVVNFLKDVYKQRHSDARINNSNRYPETAQRDASFDMFINAISNSENGIDAITEEYFPYRDAHKNTENKPITDLSEHNGIQLFNLISECLRFDISDYLQKIHTQSVSHHSNLVVEQADELGEDATEDELVNLRVEIEAFTRTQVYVSMIPAEDYFKEKGFNYTAAVNANSKVEEGYSFATRVEGNHYDAFVPSGPHGILTGAITPGPKNNAKTTNGNFTEIIKYTNNNFSNISETSSEFIQINENNNIILNLTLLDPVVTDNDFKSLMAAFDSNPEAASKVYKIYIDGNPITSLDSLSKHLTNLKLLHAANCELESIPAIPNEVQLTQLALFGNRKLGLTIETTNSLKNPGNTPQAFRDILNEITKPTVKPIAQDSTQTKNNSSNESKPIGILRWILSAANSIWINISNFFGKIYSAISEALSSKNTEAQESSDTPADSPASSPSKQAPEHQTTSSPTITHTFNATHTKKTKQQSGEDAPGVTDTQKKKSRPTFCPIM